MSKLISVITLGLGSTMQLAAASLDEALRPRPSIRDWQSDPNRLAKAQAKRLRKQAQRLKGNQP